MAAKKKIISRAKSFDAWELYEFVRGRKRMVATVIGSILGYFATRDVWIAFATGPILEGAFATAEFWYKQKEKK